MNVGSSKTANLAPEPQQPSKEAAGNGSQDRVSPDSSTGTTSLFTITGSSGSTDFGDYVSDAGGLDTSYHFYVEVPPGQSRLVVDLFDADIGLGGANEDTAGRDRNRGTYDTSANYTIINPSGSQRTTSFTTGNAAGPAGSDNAWLTLFDTTGDNMQDNFGTVAYNNNNGLVPFAGNWIETNDNNNAATGEILITNGELRIEENGGAPSTIEREANLLGQGFSNATLSFDVRTQNVEAGDQMRVQVSNNGGASWTTLETFTGTIAASSRSYDITSSIASNTRVRFIHVSGYSGTDRFFVDNFRIDENGVDSGHWEVRVDMSSAITNGDDINALGIRSHDGNSGAGGTEFNLYVDSVAALGVNPPNSGTTSRSYTLYPYVTSGCSCSENDFDFDSNNGNVGVMTFTDRSSSFSQMFPGSSLSATNVWKRNVITGWTSDGNSAGYGIWQAELTINSYLVAGTPNGNYGNVYLANSQAAANPPAANPTTNAFRIYVPTDSGAAPVKPYLEQTVVNEVGPNPPVVGQTSQLGIILKLVNPTPYPISFDTSRLVSTNVPGGGVVYAGLAIANQGTIVSEPSIGGTGNVTWDPGTVAANTTAVLSYNVNVTPVSAGQRLPITATPASGLGARAQYVDETGNANQTRATYTLGPLCELAVTVGAVTASPATISGVITATTGAPLGGVVVRLNGDRQDRTITDANGFYRFTNVDIDGFYSVRPAFANYSFSPTERSFSLVGDRTDAVFTGIAGNPTQNPLDDEGFFVRQQYLDFLGREPDQSGWLYWSDEIAACGADAACIRARRLEVSTAFFMSAEFQQTGNFVYLMYKTGLGRRLTLAEFDAGRSRLLAGSDLNASKNALTQNFVQQAEFVSRYNNATSAAAFVDAVIANILQASQIDLSAERAALLAAYNQGVDLTDQRSRVVRAASEHATVHQTEFNRAFVLSQYFGYLRRDPDQAGYDFWVNVLNNRAQNNFFGMVCAFVTSTEYQQRFSLAVTRGNGECGQ
jgi:hypothetical protein